MSAVVAKTKPEFFRIHRFGMNASQLWRNTVMANHLRDHDPEKVSHRSPAALDL
jgi:hypothetical protein